jgi:hypothetical protein
LEEKQQRRLAEERKRQEMQRAARKRTLITVGIALLVGALVVFLIINDSSRNNGGDSVDAGVAAGEAGCGEVETPEQGEAEHVEEGTDIQYTTSPPTSGNHYPTAADPGFYSDPIPEENVVHNLEHGQIVIWYSPDAPQATIDSIESVVDEEAIALVAVPYDGIPSGSELSFTAWGALQSCSDFSNDILSQFRAEFQGRGPENVGIPTFDAPDQNA